MDRPPAPPLRLLPGVLALQAGLVDRSAFVAAAREWVRTRDGTLAGVLVDRGALDPAHRPMLEGLAAAHAANHGGDPVRALAAMDLGHSTREALAELGDSALTGPLTRVDPHGEGETGPAPSLADPDRTMTLAAGDPATAVRSALATAGSGGRFRVLRPHARGGLGVVYVALDAELEREVALKRILDDHADEPDSRARFLVEAQITGGLEHPGIVPVYGLGTYEGGRPYYAMRLIRGDSLREAIAAFHAGAASRADSTARSLGLRKLLRRLIDVCNAIEYAHSRGVLHRDIKPGNIIVGKHGETLVVDWGLAKVLGRAEPVAAGDERPLTVAMVNGSTETRPGSTIGTPAYMSPEQAAGDVDQLGAASDVYSLGATLYELLTGKPPLEGNDVAEVLRAVREGRWAAPRAVDPTIAPALEAICLKAMATRPDDRYDSPRTLAEDLERWMADEPVSARFDPPLVRLSRWARKHRDIVAVGAALLQTTVVVLGVSTYLLSKSRARIEQEHEAAVEGRRIARAAQARAEAVNTFLFKDLLVEAEPMSHLVGDRLTVRMLLDQAASAVQGNPSLAGQPAVEGTIRSALGATYRGLGLYAQAEDQLRQAITLLDGSADAPADERVEARSELAWLLHLRGRNDEARTFIRHVIAWARSVLGPEHPETLDAADTLARIDLASARFDEAIDLLRRNLDIQRRRFGPDHRRVLRTAGSLARGLQARALPADLAEAATIHRALQAARGQADRPEKPEASAP